jgi:hypothetical protein
VRIVDPANRADDVVNTGYTDKVPLSRFRADILAECRAWRTADRGLGAVRWPAGVQPYITAMRLTFDPATIGCLRALAGGQLRRPGRHRRQQPGLHRVARRHRTVLLGMPRLPAPAPPASLSHSPSRSGAARMTSPASTTADSRTAAMTAGRHADTARRQRVLRALEHATAAGGEISASGGRPPGRFL